MNSLQLPASDARDAVTYWFQFFVSFQFKATASIRVEPRNLGKTIRLKSAMAMAEAIVHNASIKNALHLDRKERFLTLVYQGNAMHLLRGSSQVVCSGIERLNGAMADAMSPCHVSLLREQLTVALNRTYRISVAKLGRLPELEQFLCGNVAGGIARLILEPQDFKVETVIGGEVTESDMTDSRKAFEAWLVSQKPPRGYSTTRNVHFPSEYAFAATNLAWKAWQFKSI